MKGADGRKRAERRHAFMASQTADQHSLLRIGGTKYPLIADNSMHQYIESENSLVQLPGTCDLLVDRFDGRMLLDVIPSQQPTADLEQKKVNAEHDESELNFERYADLIDQARQQCDEEDCIDDVDYYWNTSIQNGYSSRSVKPLKGVNIGYDYSSKTKASPSSEDLSNTNTQEKFEDILSTTKNIHEILGKLDKPEIDRLNDLAIEYGVSNYTRLLSRSGNNKPSPSKNYRQPHHTQKNQSRQSKYNSDFATNEFGRLRERQDQSSLAISACHSSPNASDLETLDQISFVSEFNNNDVQLAHNDATIAVENAQPAILSNDVTSLSPSLDINNIFNAASNPSSTPLTLHPIQAASTLISEHVLMLKTTINQDESVSISPKIDSTDVDDSPVKIKFKRKNTSKIEKKYRQRLD
ncbi:hypothetical protein RTP6_002044 [Batrachochytrium dendrobatidis]